MIISRTEPVNEAIYDINSPYYLDLPYIFQESEGEDNSKSILSKIKKTLADIRLKRIQKKEAKANEYCGRCVSETEKYIKGAYDYEEKNFRYFTKLVDDFLKDPTSFEGGSFKQYAEKRTEPPDYVANPNRHVELIHTSLFITSCADSPKLRAEFDAFYKKLEKPSGSIYKKHEKLWDDIIKVNDRLDKRSKQNGFTSIQVENFNWLVDELKLYGESVAYLGQDCTAIIGVYEKLNKAFPKTESTVTTAASIYGIDESVKPVIDYSSIERSPLFNKVVNEYFDLSHRPTRQYLLGLDEAGQNAVITNLTSKLYDKIVKKCEDIDYGEIPNTKGDITKLSKYEDMKETIRILHDLLKEYKQDTGPVDELSVAFSNVETQKELFEKAYRYNTELPMVMYCNIVLGIITGISYMIATCVEFIKDPGTNTFQLALDRNSYRRTKDHTIYNTLRQFNKSCSKGDFDKAMNAVMTSQARSFAGAAVVGGVAIGAVATILVLIPILRELIFMFYYMRMRVSDFFDINADLFTMNAYSIEANNEFTKQEKKEIIERQLKYVNNFRKIANAISFEVKKAEVEADKEKKSDDESKELIDDIGGVDTGSNGSALF